VEIESHSGAGEVEVDVTVRQYMAVIGSGTVR
jgi:hypothetical protein